MRSYAYVIENFMMLIPYVLLLSLLISNLSMLIGCSGFYFANIAFKFDIYFNDVPKLPISHTIFFQYVS